LAIRRRLGRTWTGDCRNWMGLNKPPSYGANVPGASCDSGQALEKAQNGNEQPLEKGGMDLGLAAHRLGFGATSAWAWRHVGLGLAPHATESTRYVDQRPIRGRLGGPAPRRPLRPGASRARRFRRPSTGRRESRNQKLGPWRAPKRKSGHGPLRDRRRPRRRFRRLTRSRRF
jgi:hypothetical protein